MADWRKRFFFNGGTTTPLGGDNSRQLWDNAARDSSSWRQASGTSYAINYTAILAWIKSGPQVLPAQPPRRPGAVLLGHPRHHPGHRAAPSDQRFWRAYIDYVIGTGDATHAAADAATAGRPTRAGARCGSRPSRASAQTASPATRRPYMHYNDNPIRPRLHFWFGPLTMLCFLVGQQRSSYDRNWLPGTCHESQCWQLKAGINSALDDIQKNHPNDWVVADLLLRPAAAYTTPRVPLGRDYTRMKNALFFPFTLLDNLGDPNAEIRPYNSELQLTPRRQHPQRQRRHLPGDGLQGRLQPVLQRAPATTAAAARPRWSSSRRTACPTRGRRAPSPTAAAYNSLLHQPRRSAATSATTTRRCVTDAMAAVADRSATWTRRRRPGYSTAKTPARVHAIAFGDLFETTSTHEDRRRWTSCWTCRRSATRRRPTATSIETYKIITGDYNTRIENLRQALERIMQSGVQVSLIR